MIDSKPSRRVVVLFGAGASFGAGGILPEAPPLGQNLYEALSRLYPGTWGLLPAEIQAAFHADFETGMQLVYEKLGVAISQLMRDMAIYFVQFRSANGNSLYDRLITTASGDGYLHSLAFATLNYECVLEFALAKNATGVDYFGAGDSTHVPVWKLHGSCNMFSHQVQATEGVLYTPGVVFEGGIEATLDTSLVVERCLTSALAPVMSLYMAGKPLAVSPTSIKAVQQIWASAVAGAQAVICIGLRPNPPDEHIWNPLAATSAPVYFVGDTAGFSAWAAECRSGPSVSLGGRLGDSFHRIIDTAREHASQ